jgi:SAM-dependent methyltransferase
MFSRSAQIYDLLYREKDYAGEAAVVHHAVQARNPAARTLLDVACGTGRHLEQLARWYEVEGLDLDADLLAVAADRLPGVPLHAADMREFKLGRSFDIVTCLFSSIGYLRDEADMVRAVANMSRHLAPGGVLVVEPWMTPDSFEPRFPGRLLSYQDDTIQAVRMSVGRVDGLTSVIEFHYLVARPGRIEHATETHVMGLFTIDQYRRSFDQAGLAADYDARGLTGRGLWIGQRRTAG